MTQRIHNHSQPFTTIHKSECDDWENSCRSFVCVSSLRAHGCNPLTRFCASSRSTPSSSKDKTHLMLGGLSHFNAATRQVERYSKFQLYLKIFKDIRGLYAKEMKSTLNRLNRLASQNSAIKAAMASTAPLSQFFFQFSKTPVPCASSFLMYPSAS